nr:16S rRNA (cytidine(1402)-2'-O)-methyltransferase [Desulfonatronospira sp.]
MSRTPSNSALWVVATPLGNPGDISGRALEVLSECDLVLAEDTRRAGMLFKNLGIRAREFLSLHEHNEAGRIHQVVSRIMAGGNCALISDAGTPLMADPGYRLVRYCRESGIDVIPVPGPCSIVAALAASGLPPYPFSFLGFPPRKAYEIEKTFKTWQEIPATLVFFERKNRITTTLQIALQVLGPREFCLARELTKKYEEFIIGRLDSIELDADRLLGEITVIIAPQDPGGSAEDTQSVELLISECLKQGLRPREVVQEVRKHARGWSGKEIYALMHTMRRDA